MSAFPARTSNPSRRARWSAFCAEVRESFGMALDAMVAHKLRSSLTLLGILVGVFSIIVVMTAIRVFQGSIESEMAALGTDTFQFQRWPAFHVDDSGGSIEKYLRRKRLTLPQAKLLEDRCSLAKRIGVVSRLTVGEAKSRFAKTNPNVELSGVSPGTFETRNWPIAEGRAFTESDLDGTRLVCVLGASLANKLFPHGHALGDAVKFSGINYTVVGVIEAKGAFFGQDQDNFMVIPITTGLDRFGRERSVNIQVQAWNQAVFDDTLEQARGVLRAVRQVPPGAEDDFEVFSNDSLIDQFRNFTLAVRAGAGVISSIALLAAGIGIMNIMLVSVTERTREIGIRRAIGAKKRTIMTQFIMEAVALCQVGGIIGVILGILGGNAAALAFKAPPNVPVDWVLLGLGICSLVGLVFGTYPAYKAANLDPIESLRYE
ncbi:MAG: ABC transporter permease [Verrucomicrobiota bacterium]